MLKCRPTFVEDRHARRSYIIMKSSLLLALLVCASSTWAQGFAPAPCVDSASTIERNGCLAAEVQSIDKLLRIEVKRIERLEQKHDEEDPMFQLAPPFMTAQQRWESFREAECTFRRLTYGPGTGAAAEGMLCQIEYGRARLEYLKSIR